MDNSLDTQLHKAGFRLFGEQTQIISLIQNLLNTKNTRYILAIPYLLYKHGLTQSNFDTYDDKETLGELFEIKQVIMRIIRSKLDLAAHKSEIRNPLFPSFEEFYNAFYLQYKNDQPLKTLNDKVKIYEERTQLYALSQLFTAKEREIINKLLEDKPLTKTECEYYSRKTKKKCKSILSLQKIAAQLVELKVRHE